MLELFEPIRLLIVGILNFVWFDFKLFFLNGWSLIHFFTGFYLFKLINISNFKLRSKFIILSVILISWELFELIMIQSGVIYMQRPLFETEFFIDVVWDILYGLIGGLIAWKKKKNP